MLTMKDKKYTTVGAKSTVYYLDCFYQALYSIQFGWFYLLLQELACFLKTSTGKRRILILKNQHLFNEQDDYFNLN